MLSTISDKRSGVSSDDSTVTYFNPDVVAANDYYPFGMLEPGRQYPYGNSANYRYGFNGKEQDNEVEGTGNFYDYGMRGYDPRIGRFPSVDPLTKKYPWYTPYQYAGNKPVWKVDIDGMEENEEDLETKEGERAEAEKDREKEEAQAKIRNALKSPTAEEDARRRSEMEELLKKTPEERGRAGAAALNRVGNSLRNYVPNAFEAAKIALSPPDARFVETFVKNAPGPNFGVTKFDGPLSTDALRSLSDRLGGVEVAQIFVKQGKGGFYSVIYGTNAAISIPQYESGTPYLLSHVHPSGNPSPSFEDIELLKAVQNIQKVNSEPVQSSSTIVPIGKPNAQFNITTPTINNSAPHININLKPQ